MEFTDLLERWLELRERCKDDTSIPRQITNREAFEDVSVELNQLIQTTNSKYKE